MANNKSLWLCLYAMSFISGCTQNVTLLGETAKLAVIGQSDAQLPVQKIEQLPYASAYLKVGKAPQAFVVLATSENDQQKWVTADKNMIVTDHGRIVKTIGFGEDITYIENLKSDPLALGLLKPETPKQWHTKATWAQIFRGGYELVSEFEYKGIEQTTILEKPRSLARFDEKIVVPALGQSYTNIYWLNPDNGWVVKTLQYMGPSLAQVQFTILKSYAQ
jgi:hypothetical protein